MAQFIAVIALLVSGVLALIMLAALIAVIPGVLLSAQSFVNALDDRRAGAIDRPAFRRHCVLSLLLFLGPIVLIVLTRLLIFGVIQLAAVLTRS